MESILHNRPPVVLTFLAPAVRCNQRCINCYITDVADEPVTSFDLTPGDYRRFFDQFVEGGVPILSVKFQGYEVTLPKSWPYLEAVFLRAAEVDVRRSFITNGMLLDRWVERIVDLEVGRITVSLDGASPEVNDHFRGLSGAFLATTRSIERFLQRAPEYADRMAIASLLRDDDSFRSLLEMPTVVARLGLRHWVVSVELGLVGGEVIPLVGRADAIAKFRQLGQAAAAAGVEFHVSDEYGALTPVTEEDLDVWLRPNPEFFYRMEPTGQIHIGRNVYRRWNPAATPRWNPHRDDAVKTVGYWEAVLGSALKPPSNRETL